MAKHHTVQDKYLSQWKKSDTDNQLNIYVIPENKIIERGPGWKGFWRDDFNKLDEREKPYLHIFLCIVAVHTYAKAPRRDG